MFGVRRGCGGERGAVTVLIAAALVGLLAFGALSIDVGSLYAERIRLHNIADAAALAGARALPGGQAVGIQGALDCAIANGLTAAQTVVTVGGSGGAEVTVSVTGTKELTFAKVIDIDSAQVGAGATAIVGTPTALDGEALGNIVPMGAEICGTITYGTEITLKDGGGGGSNGNYQLLALGGRGGKNIAECFANGFAGILKIGDVIETEPGNKSGPTEKGLADRFDSDPTATFANHSADSPRVVTVPIVSFSKAKGRSEVTILGFASFFLTERPGSGKESIVKGRFLKTVVPTAGSVSTTETNYGITSIKLIR